MIRNIAALAVMAVLPALASAATYDCTVKKLASKSPKPFWSAKIVLKDGAPDAGIFIIEKDGTGVALAGLVKASGDAAAVSAALSRYERLPVVGLRKQAQSLDLNLGHVETANKKDAAPMDADAWASPETKMIAVTDVRAGLMASCRRE